MRRIMGTSMLATAVVCMAAGDLQASGRSTAERRLRPGGGISTPARTVTPAQPQYAAPVQPQYVAPAQPAVPQDVAGETRQSFSVEPGSSATAAAVGGWWNYGGRWYYSPYQHQAVPRAVYPVPQRQAVPGLRRSFSIEPGGAVPAAPPVYQPPATVAPGRAAPAPQTGGTVRRRLRPGSGF